ncbi:Transcriptional activator ci [Penaeus vannamei]|uniref:Transcriptional activator ci n=1 Tax=Penaeus vannamei TaxID=6689 RepID=A0A3R7PWN7_PENVA|nr:Transcriptional activator ci [Penaeus vannamei]
MSAPLVARSPQDAFARSDKEECLAVGGDYLGMSGLAATRLSEPHLVPSSTLTSADLPSFLDGSRLTSPRPSLRQSRKRALSSSPYSDSFDINSMIRFSPNSLVSIMNGSRSSSASGSYGHLSAGAISPALGVHPSVGAATHLQQLQAHLMRGASLPGSPFLAPSPLLQHSPSTLATHQSLFSLSSQPSLPPLPPKAEGEKKASPTISSTMEEDKASKVKKEASSTTSAGACGTGGVSAAARDDDGLKEEPPDFIETHCHWKESLPSPLLPTFLSSPFALLPFLKLSLNPFLFFPLSKHPFLFFLNLPLRTLFSHFLNLPFSLTPPPNYPPPPPPAHPLSHR